MVKVPYLGVPKKSEEKDQPAEGASFAQRPPIRKGEARPPEPPIRRPVKIGDGKDVG